MKEETFRIKVSTSRGNRGFQRLFGIQRSRQHLGPGRLRTGYLFQRPSPQVVSKQRIPTLGGQRHSSSLTGRDDFLSASAQCGCLVRAREAVWRWVQRKSMWVNPTYRSKDHYGQHDRCIKGSAGARGFTLHVEDVIHFQMALFISICAAIPWASEWRSLWCFNRDGVTVNLFLPR